MIRLETDDYGDIWAHLDVPKLTHSKLREALLETNRLAESLGYPTVFCLVANSKRKLAVRWGFRFVRKVNYNGRQSNIMIMETKHA